MGNLMLNFKWKFYCETSSRVIEKKQVTIPEELQVGRRRTYPKTPSTPAQSHREVWGLVEYGDM
jgi:hypothetical protein